MDKTVLIIDDDDMLRKTLARGLRNEHFNVLTAQSADMARDVLARIRVDAIILDRMMTGTDGLTFLQQIRSTGDTTPVIMLTAMTGPENTIDGLSGGADDYLGKPFQMRELVLRLNNIMRTRHSTPRDVLPDGLMLIDNEFFVMTNAGAPVSLGLSGEEKKLLQNLTSPIGNIAPAAPMVAKRLRNKINIVLSNIDIITIRGRGYKLIQTPTATDGI
ncbi:MAG: response regulator transcription factor [Alphaproteobacteria bacterium]|nr:response regulator transcription factor [Alphaproteobacteria bacterium]